MKHYLLIEVLLIALLLASCAPNPFPRKDYTLETWPRAIETHPNLWLRGADRWFFTARPNLIEKINRHAPPEAAVSTTMVNVGEFKNVYIDGTFQVQIFGTDELNSVYVYGPNAETRAVSVRVKNNTLYVKQFPSDGAKLERTIVRIGVRKLNRLIQAGCGIIETYHLCSNQLDIMTKARGGGNIYIAGPLKIRRILHHGDGTINIFGAVTPWVDIHTNGGGTVNISGRIGVRLIKHEGSGNINIVGGESRALSIFASGSGKISIKGNVNLRSLEARDNVHVYLDCVNSQFINASLCNEARIGMKGNVQSLHVLTNDYACFAGRYLLANHAYLKAFGKSHINVSGNEVYASATENSSIYYFGKRTHLIRFTTDRATVVSMY